MNSNYSQFHKIELTKGNSFYLNGQYNNALSHYDSSLKIESNYYPAFYNSGNANYRIAQKSNDSLKSAYFDKAISFYASAISEAETKPYHAVRVWCVGNTGPASQRFFVPSDVMQSGAQTSDAAVQAEIGVPESLRDEEESSDSLRALG